MKEMEELTSIDAIERFIDNHTFSFLYVSRQDCSVCHAILPKLRELLDWFPRISLGHIQGEAVGEIASRYLIFTAPALLLFVEGKELLREDRFVQFGALERKLENLMDLLS
ncbi:MULTISPECIES: thioredoxin family protein [Paenibacillus]|uniref:Thiol reductase thioredoxin n=1 Tax=Paenibacillus lautus TaxID=1401 RepID=A0A1R1B076_PAELA|nr:thioredoxin family protein [Paenibacillus lautus]OME91949.1 thiol reductase thioredoxin [Paenibacillus lautus]